MEDITDIFTEYAQLWQRARLIIGSYFDYLEHYAETDSEAEPPRPPVPSLRDFNAIVTCLKRTMEAHHALLLPGKENDHEEHTNEGASTAINTEILALLKKYQENGDEAGTD